MRQEENQVFVSVRFFSLFVSSFYRIDGIVISHMPYGPTAYFGLLNVVTRHDIKGFFF